MHKGRLIAFVMPPAMVWTDADISAVVAAIERLNGKSKPSATASLCGVVMSSVINAGQKSLNIGAIRRSHFCKENACHGQAESLLLSTVCSFSGYASLAPKEVSHHKHTIPL